jgi:hypothetical protein
MGDWSKFFEGIGQIAKEFNAAREAQNQTNPSTQASAPLASPGTRSNVNTLYPDLKNVIGEESNNNGPVLVVPPPKLSLNERRRRNQQVSLLYIFFYCILYFIRTKI